jgi:viologen exporter family transport system ATP-binding protein
VIEADGLTKVFRRPVKGPGLRGAVRHLIARRYQDVRAVDAINLSIGAGEAVAYVGPNGAGKSTTIKLLCGILVPSGGQVRVAGLVPHANRTANAKQIGVLFGHRSHLWWDLPVRDSLELLRAMYGVPVKQHQARLARFDEVLDIKRLLPVAAGRLSLGQRVRVDLAAALLHGPRVVYLDEPTIGLDLAVKDRVRGFLKQLRVEGTTLVLTTHDLADIEDVCDRMVIIDEGRVIYDGAMAGVKDQFGRERVIHLQFATPVDMAEVAARTRPAIVEAIRSETECSVRFDPLLTTAGQIIAMVQPMAAVTDLSIDEPTVENVVRKVYAGELDVERKNMMDPVQ